MRKEVQVWNKINGHPNIVKFYDADVSSNNGDRYLHILSEYCSEGHLLDLLEKHEGKLSEGSIITILKHIVRGTRHMHDQSPPIAHRDIKVENILLKDRKFKLCDFGSVSTELMDPTKASLDELEDAFDQYEKYTTFMYRPPEMLDKFSNYEIGLKVDCWMLG
jgi:AP2-associated kinase